MHEPALTATEALAWNERTAQTWRKLLDEHPEILALTCDIYSGVNTVADLLQHIFAVETRYAQRLAGLAESPYEAIPLDAAGLFAAHEAAIELYRAELAKDIDWDQKMEFQTLTMGRARSSRKTIFFHAILHSIRHYAQLATLVRTHGYKPGTPMDYLLMGFERVD